MRAYRRWSEEEVNLLREVYPKEGSPGFIRASKERGFPARASRSVNTYAQLRGWKSPMVYKPPWSEKERQLLRDVYPEGGVKAYQEHAQRLGLVNRRKNAITRKASELGAVNNPKWSEEEVTILENIYWLKGSRVTSEVLRTQGYHRTPCAVSNQAVVQGLRVGENPWE